MANILSIAIGFFSLSFLVFIHELGHYFAAIFCKMKVETFSVGFGKPLCSFNLKGVRWQIGILPFGGFVKIAGMDQSDPQVKGGFYSTAPWKRMVVAIAGPLVNIFFTLLAFSAIYFSHGRVQPFSKHTQLVGFVDNHSSIQEQKIQPGDRIQEIDGHQVDSFQDILVASIIKKNHLNLKGMHIDYFKKTFIPFSEEVSPYLDPKAPIVGLKTIGIKGPAQYLIYKSSSGLPINPSINDSGIQDNDRIVWANGEIIFSLQQLSTILNQNKVLLTVKRNDKVFLTRVPRIKIADLRLSQYQKEELIDHKHALKLQSSINQLDSIPYEIDSKGNIVTSVAFIDDNAEEATVYNKKGTQFDSLLKKGDKILAIGGEKVSNSLEIFDKIQNKKLVLIVQRGDFSEKISSKIQDQTFIDEFHPKELSSLISMIGIPNKKNTIGNYYLLNPIQPILEKELVKDLHEREKIQKDLQDQLKVLTDNKDLEKKKFISKQLNDFNHRLYLGVNLQDRSVVYNPNPLEQVYDVLKQTKMTFSYLISGQVSPKWMAGPVGIIQAVQKSVDDGFKEILYWVALISLNLAIFNLLPLPILDGGHILMSIYEQITGRLIPAKVKERIMIPFAVLLIGFSIYVLFNDISRIFGHYFT
jgi:regulator of sigma E protease